MAKGQSGRLVIEVEPGFKRRLYSALASDGLTLKAWFVKEAKTYLDERASPPPQPPSPNAKAESSP